MYRFPKVRHPRRSLRGFAEVFWRVPIAIAGLVAGLAGLGGCSGDTTGPSTRDEVVVFGYLYVGEAVTDINAVYVTRVRPVLKPYDPEEAAVDGALVTLLRQGAPGADTLRRVAPGSYANPDVVIAARTTYRLRVEIPGDRVLSAETTTPHFFMVERGPPALPRTVRHEVLQDSFPMIVSCEEPEQIFLVDVFCREQWQDARYINPFGDNESPDDYQEYGGDNSQPRRIFAYFRARHLVQVGSVYIIDFYGAMMAFFGEYDVQTLSVDDNYYNYLYRDHPEENGGINGGLGVFGSACRKTWRIEVIE